MSPASTLRWQRFLTVTLLIVSVLAGSLFVQQLLRGIVLETDLQALFPRAADSRLINHASDKLAQEFGDQLLLAVRADEREQALAAADDLEAAIVASGFIQLQQEEQVQSLSDQQALLQTYRFHLLTDTQRSLLEGDKQRDIIQHAQTALFGFSTGSSISPLQDPLAFFADYVQVLQPFVPGELVGDRLVISADRQTVVLLSAALQGDAFNLALHDQLNAWLMTLRQKLTHDQETRVELLVSGAVFHAAEAAANAQREVTIISLGSSLGILLLFLLTFRRLKPLLLSFASVIYGSAVAFALNHFLFGQLHLMTLVFGASLIGVAIDYSLHYLCKHQSLSCRPGISGQVTGVLETLLPALALGLITSLLGYSCLLQAELPGLQQIASFSIIGLAAAWLFVLGLYPYFFRKPLPPPATMTRRLVSLPWAFIPRLGPRQLALLAAVMLAGIIWGLMQLQLGSDLRLLYKPSPALLASEKTMQQLLQGFAPNQYFLVRAESEERLLQKEEQFRREVLDLLRNEGVLRDYAAVTRIVPSQAQQQSHYALLREKIYREQGLASSFMSSAGFGAPAIEKLQAEFAAAKDHMLPVADWLAVARPDQRVLWLGEVDGVYASVIALRGISDVSVLAAAAEKMDGISWVDRVADMSRLLKQLQESAMVLLGLAYLVVLGLMWIAFRHARAMLLVGVPLLASLLTLALLSSAGVSINLFHIFGCYLILGLGMDYSIFAYQSGAGDESCQRAIFLSALTSGLSFGLLALSSTPMVSAFGITLLLGSVFNVFLAPLVGRLPVKAA